LPRPETLLASARQRHDLWADRLPAALRSAASRKRAAFSGLSALMRADILTRFIALARRGLADRQARLTPALDRAAGDKARELGKLAQRLHHDILSRDQQKRRRDLADLNQRLAVAGRAQVANWRLRLDATERLRQTLGYQQTLQRGYAVVRGDGKVVQSRTEAERAAALEIQFHDGRLVVGARAAPRKGAKTPPDQGSLF
jgi:exodeoxyribonuclease VII large subunit